MSSCSGLRSFPHGILKWHFEMSSNVATVINRITVKILCVESVFAVLLPRKLVVVAARRHAVVADAHYAVFIINDASTHLCYGILAALRSEERCCHEVIGPVEVVGSLRVNIPKAPDDLMCATKRLHQD